MKNERLNNIKNKFINLFGESEEQIRYFASPGRVNLIGEHIDYCGGFVFPAALTLDNVTAVRINGSRKINLSATDLNEIYTVDLDNIDDAKKLKWGNYQAGVAKELINYGINVKGVDMLFDGTVPYGSGLSSSASIELVTGLALSSLFAEKIPSLVELAVIGKKAENNFCGVNCGIMDQFASAMGKENKAILLNCNTLEYEYVPLDLGDYMLILANTNVKHSLGASKYNERRKEVDLGLRILQNADKDNSKNNLCDYTLDDFNKHINEFKDLIIKNRVLHVISENERVLKAVTLLREGKLFEFGAVLMRSQ